MKIPVIVALDEETHKLWRKLPDQHKSEFVRNLIRDFITKEQPSPKASITKSFSESYDDTPPQEKPSKKHEYSLSEMAHIVKHGKKKSHAKRKASIAKQLTEVSTTPK